MKVITAPERYQLKDDDISIFLAGGITNCPDWQSVVIEKLEKMNIPDNFIIFNPRRSDFPIGDPSAAYEQISWEYEYLNKVDIFSMYFSAGDSDQPICMYELGRYIMKMQMRFPYDWDERIVVSVESGYKRTEDVAIQMHLATDDMVVPARNDNAFGTIFTNLIDIHISHIYNHYLGIKRKKKKV